VSTVEALICLLPARVRKYCNIGPLADADPSSTMRGFMNEPSPGQGAWSRVWNYEASKKATTHRCTEETG
jgi:hypothetical protein